MSKRARLAIIKNDKGKSIYLHNSLKPEDMLTFLNNHYSKPDKVNELMKLGDCSVLKENLYPKSKTHSFDNPELDTCVFYGRDRNKINIKAKHFNDIDELLKQAKNSFAEYVYIFNEDSDTWSYKEISYKD